jgi:hypothetical protein
MKDLTKDTFTIIFEEGKTFDISSAIPKYPDLKRKEIAINEAENRNHERLGKKLLEYLLEHQDKVVTVSARKGHYDYPSSNLERISLSFSTHILKEKI